MPFVDFKVEVRNLYDFLETTQEHFVRAVGVSFSTVSRGETGRGTPSPLARRRIRELFASLEDEEAQE